MRSLQVPSADEHSERAATAAEKTGITRRSVLLGLILAVGLSALTPYSDCVVGNTPIAGNHFPVGAVAVLLLLSLLNLIWYRRRGRALLSTREIAVTYMLIAATSGVASYGLLRYLLPVCTVPRYWSSPGSEWERVLWPHVPRWLVVTDEGAARWFWEGLPEGATMPWGAWLGPLARWSILTGAFWVMMTCLAALVRRQWAERERLTFPLVQFPHEVLQADGRGPSVPFFANRLVWAGAAMVFSIHLVNGLHQHYPAVPQLPTYWSLNSLLVGRPWDGAVPLVVAVYFSAVAFGYLLSLEVGAGFWSSVLLLKAQAVVLRLLGYEGDVWGGAIASISEREQMGALLVLAAVLMWFLRGTARDALRRVLRPTPDDGEAGEPLGYRVAALGLMISAAVGWAWLVAAGMSVLAAGAFLLAFVSICLVLTRIIAEAGMLIVHLTFWPAHYLLMFGGTRVLGAGNLVALTFVDTVFTMDLREFLMPSVLNSFRLADQTGIPSRRLVPLFAGALVLCLVIAVPVFLATVYHRGAAEIERVAYLAALPYRFFAQTTGRLQTPESASGADYVAMVAGGGLAAALAWLRLNFVWWPIHPLGLVMASSYASLHLWFSLLLGWLCKLLTVRYTGLRGYVRLRPLFMGAIVGDTMGAVLWMVVGVFTGTGVRVSLD